MKFCLPLIVAAVLGFLLRYARKPGKLGVIGKRIRNSDHWALEDAIYEKELEIKKFNSLYEKKPKSYHSYICEELKDKQQELEFLTSLRSKYKLEE